MAITFPVVAMVFSAFALAKQRFPRTETGMWVVVRKAPAIVTWRCVNADGCPACALKYGGLKIYL